MHVNKHEVGSPSRDTASMTSTIDEADDVEANSIASHPALVGKEKQSVGVLSHAFSRVRRTCSVLGRHLTAVALHGFRLL